MGVTKDVVKFLLNRAILLNFMIEDILERNKIFGKITIGILYGLRLVGGRRGNGKIKNYSKGVVKKVKSKAKLTKKVTNRRKSKTRHNSKPLSQKKLVKKQGIFIKA